MIWDNDIINIDEKFNPSIILYDLIVSLDI